MLNVYLVIGGVLSVLGLIMTAFFNFKKAGENSEKVKTLTQEVADNEKTFDEVSEASEFRSRISHDPAYLELMRAKLAEIK